MDSDCLIKIVKSSLKEMVLRNFNVEIPPLVRKEIVDDSKEQPDALIVKVNLDKKLLTVSRPIPGRSKGEEAVFDVFHSGQYDAICTDDKRFIKRLRLFDVPYFTPAVLIAVMMKAGVLTAGAALEKLESLAPMISDDEYLTVKRVLSTWSNHENENDPNT
ncbi:MAG TPA: hypothetical protein VJ521_07125 [Acidobacteriota bacterium]|nr:hypothetical protein [Acidobacteriota bacterium]